jgi:hypothetical protein
MDPQRRAAFAALDEKAATSARGRHPLMHRTETIDYAIVLSGEITMVLTMSTLSSAPATSWFSTNHA